MLNIKTPFVEVNYAAILLLRIEQRCEVSRYFADTETVIIQQSMRTCVNGQELVPEMEGQEFVEEDKVIRSRDTGV